MATPTPFKISVPDSLLSFISARVSSARLPLDSVDLLGDKVWDYGVPSQTMAQLKQYWETQYDWRAVERGINEHLKMFTLPIESGMGKEVLDVHFVWHESSREGAIPLLFQHGWPGNFTEVERIIDDLVEPKVAGQQAYHVVAPSLPGFVFSSGSKSPDFNLRDMAAVDHKLMLALGYNKYIAQGGDWGSMVARILGADYPSHCVAVHVNMIFASAPSIWRAPLSLLYLPIWAMLQGEGSMFKRMLWWRSDESGYLEIQGTKPQTLSYALVDSPIGMLAWIRDKVQHLVDEDFVIGEEWMITSAMLYLIPGTAGHAEIYKNAKVPKKMREFEEALFKKPIGSDVDFGASIFPKDVLNIPRWWAAASVSSNIVFWKEHTKGGHFASVERPVELVEDIREFTKAFHPKRYAELVNSGKLKK